MQFLSNTVVMALLCFVTGALASLAMAPNHYWPLLFMGLSALYFCCADTKKPITALLYSYLWGFGYFVFGLSWIGNALLVEGNDYAWAWPLAVAGLPVILAPFIALPCWLARKYTDLKTLKGFAAFIVFMSVCEILRGHIFTGFPWNLFGYSWGDSLEISQGASIATIYGLSFLTIFWSSSAGFLAKNYRNIYLSLPIAALAIASLAAIYTYGSIRLANAPTHYHDTVQVRIIQPNIEQAEKWDRRKMAQHFFKMVRMSYPKKTDSKDITTLIVWPETAISYVFLQDKTAMNILKQALQSYPGPTYLATGALQRDEGGNYHNSLLVFDKNAAIIQAYNKHHLVPFGEYIPFQDWIPLEPITRFTGFEIGKKPSLMPIFNDFSILPLICYEAVFPHLSFGHTPGAIINITNDAWYGDSFGPHQHLLQARFRAIETASPLIRVANTGTSIMTDSLGRTILQTSLFEEAILTQKLPLSITSN